MSPEIDIAMRGAESGRSNPAATVLAEQAEGLGRAATMKNVVGPVLTDSLKGLYSPMFTEQEQSHLNPLLRSSDASRFFSGAVKVLGGRLLDFERTNPEVYEALKELHGQEQLFHLGVPREVVIEGVKTGVATPLRLALQIYGLEKETQDDSEEDWFVSDRAVDPDDLADIMERESFDEMLLALTRGANGFLRSDSTNFIGYSSKVGRDFFSFADPEDSSYNSQLRIDKVFAVEDGKVTGFSDDYHMAANNKRRDLQRNSLSSSGCPVRHRFPYKGSSAKQDPLVITAKKFLVDVLRESPKRPQGHI